MDQRLPLIGPSRAMPRGRRALLAALMGAGWLGLCAAGMYWAMGSDFRPGRLGPPLTQWPAGSALTRMPGARTVVAFIHPRCACTRATVAQLIRAVAPYQGVDVIVPVFMPPEGGDRAVWEEGPYVRTIRQGLPWARAVADRGGAEARRFGALTSGTVLFYDGAGRELFRGGITNKRGGAETNPGLQEFVQLLASSEASPTGRAGRVFGCPLVPIEALPAGGRT